jgi:hypothetical protein
MSLLIASTTRAGACFGSDKENIFRIAIRVAGGRMFVKALWNACMLARRLFDWGFPN